MNEDSNLDESLNLNKNIENTNGEITKENVNKNKNENENEEDEKSVNSDSDFREFNDVFSKKTVKDISVFGKKVLVRCDFNVPLENGVITDNKRIVSSLKTIRYLINEGAKIILCSHLGRPKGEVKEEYSLLPVKNELEKLLGKEIMFAKDIVGDEAQELSNNLKNGEILLLENLRFKKEEEENDEEFSKSLASLAEIFVNDAFGTAHRAHSSTEGVTKFMPAVAGFLMEKEIRYLKNALDDPEKPFLAILGGKKVSDKINVILSLLDKVDTLLIGGAMAYTFINTLGYNVGTSIVEEDKKDLVLSIFRKAKERNVKIILPIDIKVSDSVDSNSFETYPSSAMPEGKMGLDIGEKTILLFASEIAKAKTVFWNGPMGLFEKDAFSEGTKKVAEVLADLNGITIIGGGDSAAATKKYGLEDKFSHVSTGGGASLELIEGKALPGVESLLDK